MTEPLFPNTRQSKARHAGVMGWPIEHSLSPRIHGFWLREYGIEGSYTALPVPPNALESALRDLHEKGLCGVNLTVPHKEAACRFLDTIDDLARKIGAVNLVTCDDKGRLHGQNTDVFGYQENLKDATISIQNKRALILGAGGACRAVIAALQNMECRHITIANRTIERAVELTRIFSTPLCPCTAIPWSLAEAALSDAHLLVNTTTLGMKGQPQLDLSLDALPHDAAVSDIVYAPLETSLLSKAKARGHKTVGGIGMLFHQARPSFAAFFGQDPHISKALYETILQKDAL